MESCHARRGWRRFSRGVDRFHRSEKPVSPLGHSLDKPRSGSGILQRLSQLIDGGIQAVVEINKSVIRPEFLAEFLPSNHLPRPFQKERQNLKGLFLQTNPGAVLPQFSCGKVCLEDPKTDNSGSMTSRRRGHAAMPRSLALTGLQWCRACQPPTPS